jgi:hypothetical protein
MTFLKFTFWFAIGAIGAGVASTLYLISAIRRVELFPAAPGAAVVSGALLLITVGCIAWAPARKKRRPAVETITIDDPFDLSEVRPPHELAR